MSQHPFIKSIRPVNLLSFGPDTQEIELGPLNILIGPNGSGKSNFIEMIRLLWLLPEKEPWATVLETGGVDEWIWKGGNKEKHDSTIAVRMVLESVPVGESLCGIRTYDYSISLATMNSSFHVKRESLSQIDKSNTDGSTHKNFESNEGIGKIRSFQHGSNAVMELAFNLNPARSVFSQLASPSIQSATMGEYLPELSEIQDFFDRFDFHQDWEFGADLTPRDPIPVGQPFDRLDENARNLAQMLLYFKDFHRPVFDQINDQMQKFYEPLKSIDIRLLNTHLQVVIHEEGGVSTTAYRMSDGTLRWLALLVILMNPNAAPVTCIEEPELGLHPDMIPTLADLLRDASTRTQLMITTHSDALIDAFTDVPEAVCVCEKVEGSTVIRRLDREQLKVWTEKYSLGKLWMSGQIGGNRW